MAKTITHGNGKTFTSLGSVLVDGRYVPIWPIEEYLNRVEVSAEREKELREKYPLGAPEGTIERNGDPSRRW